MKRRKRENISDLPYCLHDVHMSGIRMKMVDQSFANIKLLFPKGLYKYDAEEEMICSGEILLKNVDVDFSNVYLFKVKGQNYGKIRGRKYSITEFYKKYRTFDMEIIDETYGYNKTKFAGYMYQKKKTIEFVMEFYHFGDMYYLTEE